MDHSVPQTIESTANLVGKTAAIHLKEQLNEDSIIRYDQEAEKINSEFQVKWANWMAEGMYLSSSSYTDVAVLLISWEKDVDDLEVKEEVDRLEELLFKTFNYQCSKALLRIDTGKSPQVQINMLVGNFVHEYDNPNALLILYYAGHGLPGEIQGDLNLYGKRTPSEGGYEARKGQNKVVWNHTEYQLYDAQADVLGIFDCCYANDLGGVRGEGSKKFEYLAATSRETTKRPGKDSFTSALIWALQTLVEEKDRQKFTVSELVNKIKFKAPHFPRNQTPILSERGPYAARERIVLAPLPKRDLPLEPYNDAEPAGNNNCWDPATQFHLTLKFIWEKHPTMEGIEQLARELNKTAKELNSMMHKDHSRICRIDWGGLQSPAARVVRLASRWRSLTQQRNRNPCLHLAPPSATFSTDQSTLSDQSRTPTTTILDESICVTPIHCSLQETAKQSMGYHLRMIWKEIWSSKDASGGPSWGNTRRYLVFTSLGAGVGFSWILFKSLHRTR